MNPNGTHDRELLEQVERLLHEGHPAGNPLLDDLAQTVPQARADFQQQLEERLMNQMQSHPLSIEGEEPMTTLSTHPMRNLTTPLTLAAALLAMVLVGSILLIGGSRPPTSGVIVAVVSTDTPTATFTAMPTETGDCSSQAVEFQREQLHQLQIQMTQLQSDYDATLAKGNTLTSAADIAANQADLTNISAMLTNTQTLYDQLNQGVLPCVIPADRVAVSIPISALQPVEKSWYQVGDTVDVIAGMLFVDNNLIIGADPIILNNNPVVQAVTPAVTGTPPTPQLVMQRIVLNAQVMYVGEAALDSSLPTPEGGDLNVVMLAVTPQEAVVLQWALEAKLPLTLVRSPVIPSTYIPVVVAQQFLPLGTRIKADMLTTVYWPVNLVPSDISSDPAAMVGQYVSAPVEAWQPVTSSSISQQKIYNDQIIPKGMINTLIPVAWITGIPADLKADDTVDITVSFMQRGLPEKAGELINTTVPADGFVAHKTILRGIHVSNLGMMDSTIPNAYNALSVYWTAENAFLLNWIDHAGLPFALTITHTNTAPVDLQTEYQPDGHVVVTIPLTDVPKEFTYPAQVNLLAQMSYVTSTSDFSAPDQFPSQLVTEIVVRDAQLIGHVPSSSEDTANNFTIVIPAEDLAKLRWFIEAGIPLTFAP